MVFQWFASFLFFLSDFYLPLVEFFWVLLKHILGGASGQGTWGFGFPLLSLDHPLSSLVEHILCSRKKDLIICNYVLDEISNIIHICHFFKNWSKLRQFSVPWFFIPREDGQSILWLKHVSSRRIVHNDYVF